MVSETHVAVSRNYAIPRSTGTFKLIHNLLPKLKYCVHLLNLKFYIKNGMPISKIQGVLKVKQTRWLQPYIEQNQKLRARVNNEFDKDFFKLMNNSLYGKTCENLKKRSAIKIVKSKRETKHISEKPH